MSESTYQDYSHAAAHPPPPQELRNLLNAVTCCEAVEVNPWTANAAQAVWRRAQERGSCVNVKAASEPSHKSCSQPFMVFEATERDGRPTHIIACRGGDPDSYKLLTDSSAVMEPWPKNTDLHVHGGMWRRASSLPVELLPPQWLQGLVHRNERLILTGYSVGGAVAALATLNILETYKNVDDLSHKICCYTFGAPLQGNPQYANYISRKYPSNFYHVVLDGDPVPGILTLTCKVARKEPGVVLAGLCTLGEGVAKAAAGLAMNAVAPGATAIVAAGTTIASSAVDFLMTQIKKLTIAENDNALPLPEYKFGGTLVQVDKIKEQLSVVSHFVTALELARNKVFVVEEKRLSSSLQKNIGNVLQTIRNIIEEKVQVSSGIASHQALGLPELRPEQYHKSDDSEVQQLLYPKFDGIVVWREQNGNIKVDVHGENIVLGIQVLYLENGSEKLRLHMDSYMKPATSEMDKFHHSARPHDNLCFPLRFSGPGSKGLSFENEHGRFKVELAFGTWLVPKDKVKHRVVNTLRDLKVSDQYCEMQPQKLVDLLITQGLTTIQAQCTAAFVALNDESLGPQEKDKIVNETCRVAPDEFGLLDQLLRTADATQLPDSVQNELPRDLYRAVVKSLKPDENGCLVQLFPATSSSNDWTFCNRFARTAKPYQNEEMLSRRETAQELGDLLNTAFDGLKKVLHAILKYEIVDKLFRREFKLKDLDKWRKECVAAKTTVGMANYVGTALMLVNAPLEIVGKEYDMPGFRKLFQLLGAPTGLIAAGFVGSLYLGYHAICKPLRMLRDQPGYVDVFFNRTQFSASDWGTKVNAAAELLGCSSDPNTPVTCKLEYDLHEELASDAILEDVGGWFRPPRGTDQIRLENSKRYTVNKALQLANCGLAGAIMYKIRLHMTKRSTALGLIGTSWAGKSTFAKEAFGVDSQPGTKSMCRTRLINTWSKPLSDGRDFTLFDFPGSSDYVAQHWYVRGKELAQVLVLIVKISEINTSQTVAVITEACKSKSELGTSVLICLNQADTFLEALREDQDSLNDDRTLAAVFLEEFRNYKSELLRSLAKRSKEEKTAIDLDINKDMHPCCFKPKLQDPILSQKKELAALGVKDIQWVKNWCVDQLTALVPN